MIEVLLGLGLLGVIALGFVTSALLRKAPSSPPTEEQVRLREEYARAEEANREAALRAEARGNPEHYAALRDLDARYREALRETIAEYRAAYPNSPMPVPRDALGSLGAARDRAKREINRRYNPPGPLRDAAEQAWKFVAIAAILVVSLLFGWSFATGGF